MSKKSWAKKIEFPNIHGGSPSWEFLESTTDETKSEGSSVEQYFIVNLLYWLVSCDRDK